jgi:hypothetical protein
MVDDMETQGEQKNNAPHARAKRKIEVKKWNAVAVWSWSTSFDSCAICRNSLHEPSIEYQANNQMGDEGLSIAVSHVVNGVPVIFFSFSVSFFVYDDDDDDDDDESYFEISLLKMRSFYTDQFLTRIAP